MSDTIVKLIIDTQGNVDGVSQAQGAFSSLGDTLDKVGEIAAAIGLEKLGEEAVDAAKDAYSAVSDFQSYATGLGGLLANLGNAGDSSAADFSQSTGSVSHAAQQTADEMRNYTEKMADLQDQLKTALAGQNIIDETEHVNEELESMAEAHAQKLISLQQEIEDAQNQVIDNELQREQSLQDRLDNMSDSKANDDADRLEKEQQDLADAKGDIQRQQITQQYNEEQQLADDSFARKLATAKAEGDKQNAQQEAQDQAAADAKVATVNDQITQENAAYAEQEAQTEATRDKDLANLESENAKKLAQVRQEISDEEISHTEALARIAESSGSAGDAMLTALFPTDQFAAKSESLKQALSWLNNFAPTTPFTYSDITQAAQQFTAMGVNAQKIIPIVGDISASFGKDLGTGTYAVLDGLNGRITSMQQQFGISREELAKFNGGFVPKTQEQFLEALEKIRDAKFADGMQKQMGTVAGATSNLEDNLFRAGSALIGFDLTADKPIPGGMFDTISKGITDLSNLLGAHTKDIANFSATFSAGLQAIGKWMESSFEQIVLPALKELMDDILPPLTAMWKQHGATIIQVAEFIGTLLMFAIDGLIAIFDLLVQVVVEVIDEFASVIEWGEKVWNNTQTLIDQFGLLGGVWAEMGNISRGVMEALWNDFKTYVNHVIDGINTLINVADSVMPKLPGGLTLKIPQIPHLAAGTSYFGGGGAIVGENGPEYVQMPRGSSVTPASQTRQMAGKSVVVYQTNKIYNPADAQMALNKLNYAIAIR